MKKIVLLCVTLLLVLTACGQKNIMKDYPNFKVKDHHFETKKFSEIMDDMENKVPGVYYVGFAQCPWCVALVPHLEDVLADYDLTAIYMDTQDAQFANNDSIKERYEAFLGTFPDGIENKGSSPFVFVIDANGSINGHTGTAPTHDARQNEMTDKELDYLNARLERLFDALK